MIRLSKLADYGIVIMIRMARAPERVFTAPEMATQTGIPQPMVSKILKALTKQGLVRSHRGARGGYGLGKDADRLSVADVIVALEGPIAMTACVEDGANDCEIASLCHARGNWQRINDAIKSALDGIKLAEMAQTLPPAGSVVRTPFLSAQPRLQPAD